MDDPALQLAKDLIADRTGLQVREQDTALLGKVVAGRVQALGLPGTEAYCRFLASDEDIRSEREALVALLTAGETYFFRDSGQHELLQGTVLPELIERRRTERSLRIWCAGCSTGEEVYSLAIMLDELMPDQSQWRILILGTDISRDAIARARAGRYGEWSFRNLSDERRRRYFQRQHNGWALAAAIRERVTLQTGDLMADAFPAPPNLHDMDLILCRNTFIYMVPKAISHIADKLTETLVEGGMLITGHGELYAHHLGKLRTRVYPESILYQKVSMPWSSAPRQPPPAAAATRTPRPVPPAARAQPPATAAKPGADAVADTMQAAWNQANRGRPEQAASLCRTLIASRPLCAEPHYLLALLAQERGDFAAARELLKKVIYLDASFIAAYLELGDLYERENDGGRAGKMRKTALALLQGLPGDDPVRFYGASTVADVRQFIEQLLH